MLIQENVFVLMQLCGGAALCPIIHSQLSRTIMLHITDAKPSIESFRSFP